MPAKSPAEAVATFIRAYQQALDCLTTAVLVVQRGGYYPTLNDGLLVACRRVAGLGMEAKLGGELQQPLGPDRLMGLIAATGDGLPIVEDQHPWHEARRHKALDQAKQQGLLPHILSPAQKAPAAVLQPADQ